MKKKYLDRLVDEVQRALVNKRTCDHPQHLPGVMCLYIPAGSSVKYHCPACGHCTVMESNEPTC